MNTIDDTMNNAKKTINNVADSAGHSASQARSTMLEGLHTAATVISMLRSLGVGDALGWIGLARRRGPFVPMMTFGAGFVAGAAVGVIAAPTSWIAMRGRLLKTMMGIEQQAEAGLAQAGAEIQKGAADLGDKAKTAVHKAEDMAAQSATAMKAAVTGPEGTNGGKAKQADHGHA